MLAKPSVTLKRHIKAAPEKVYQAWTQGAQLARWFGPAGAEVLLAEADARLGGGYHIVFRLRDGEEHDVSGTYREVIPNERLVFTWAWRTMPERQSLVRVDLRPLDGGTSLTLTHEQFADEPARDRHRGGWNGALDKLEQYCA